MGDADRGRKGLGLRMDSTSSRVRAGGKRAQGLDGLRALAALAVMLFHFWVYSEPVAPGASLSVGQHVWDSTKWGLFLFFVLSGFLLYRPWVGAALAARERPGLGRYLRLRAARIAPAYYLAVGGAFLIAALGSAPPMRLPTHGTAALFLAFGENFSAHSLRMLDSPMWTLPIEVSFYLALPAIGILGLRLARNRSQQLLLMAALVAVGVAWAHLASGLWFAGVVLPQMLPFFALGMAVAVAVEGRTVPRRLCRLAVAGAVLAYLLDLVLNVWTPGLAGALEDMPVALGFSLLVAVGAAGEWVPRLMRARFAVW